MHINSTLYCIGLLAVYWKEVLGYPFLTQSGRAHLSITQRHCVGEPVAPLSRCKGSHRGGSRDEMQMLFWRRRRRKLSAFERGCSCSRRTAMVPLASGEAEPQSRRGILSLTKQGFEMVRPNLGIMNEGGFLIISGIVGLLTGSFVTLFKLAIGLVKGYLYGDFIGLFPISMNLGIVALVPLLGGLVVTIIQYFNRDFGPGIGGLIEEVDNGSSFSPRRALAKASAAVATLGTGNSLGPEGPAVELGVASSRLVCKWTSLTLERQRILLGAGAAAGVAAGFNAPIAGVFFTLEVVGDAFSSKQQFDRKGISSVLLCAAVAALVARLGLHEEYALRPAPYHLESPLVELPLYLGLGFVAGVVAWVFKSLMTYSKNAFQGKIPQLEWLGKLPWWSKPLIGAFFSGLIGIFYPQILFFGYDTLDNLLANTGKYGTFQLFQLCFIKAAITAVCFGSGLVGGTFAPSLFLGATAGACYQRLLVQAVALLKAGPITAALGSLGMGTDATVGGLFRVAESQAYAMVGAASVLSAVYRAPLTGSLLLFELTKDYDIILPLMASAGVASLVLDLLKNKTPPANVFTVETQVVTDSQSSLSTTSADTIAAVEQALQQPTAVDFVELGLSHVSRRVALMQGMTTEDALIPKVLALWAFTPADEAVSLFRTALCDVAVVLEEGDDGIGSGEYSRRRLVGIVSLRDVVKTVEEGKGHRLMGEVCRKDYLALGNGASLENVFNMMESNDIRFVPIVTDADMEAWTESSKPLFVGAVSRESVRVALKLRESDISLSHTKVKEALGG